LAVVAAARTDLAVVGLWGLPNRNWAVARYHPDPAAAECLLRLVVVGLQEA